MSRDGAWARIAGRVFAAVLAGFAVAMVLGRHVVFPIGRQLLPNGLYPDGTFVWISFWIRFAPLHFAHGAVVGWTVGRIAGCHRAIALLIFVAVGLPRALPDVITLAVAGDPDFLPVFVQTFLPVIAVVAGGIAGVRKSRGDAACAPRVV